MDRSPLLRRVGGFVKKHWFTMGIPATVLVTYNRPEPMRPGGRLRTEKWRDGLVAGAFLCAGLSLNTQSMMRACASWRAHMYVQLFSLVAMPCCFALVVPTLCKALDLPQPFVTGLVFLACLPTTVGLSTALTKNLNGDLPLTIFNAAIGNVLGVFASPLLCLYLTGYQPQTDPVATIKKLAFLLGVPVFVGMAIRMKWTAMVHDRQHILGPVQQLCILTFLSTVVSQSSYESSQQGGASATPTEMARLFALVVSLYTSVFFLGFAAAKLSVWRMCEGQRIAGVFCATQKTAAMGIPMLNFLFAGDPQLAMITLPMLMYHPTQLALGSVLGSAMLRRGLYR